MLVLATTLNHLPVISPGYPKLGELSDIIVDPSNGHLLGFTVKSGILSPLKIISITDVIALDERVVIVNNPESLVAPDEIVRVNAVLKQKIRVIGAKAVTESGTYLGRVQDVVISTEPAMIVRFYLHHYLNNRILVADKVSRIEKKKIIFSDDVTTIPASAESATA